MCIMCGKTVEDESGVSFGYIHKNLRLTNDEIVRLREKDLRNLLRQKKLYLVLDLDHTLLHSARPSVFSAEEQYLKDERESLPDALRSSLFGFYRNQMMIKLRPFVHTFLKEASNLFEMYIYTMGERPYALHMAKLLDPTGIYFQSKIITKGDCTTRRQKGLDVVNGGQASAILILDDKERVWSKHKENLILMERYDFFASSSRKSGLKRKSLSELRNDENEEEGALSRVLSLLRRIHSMFFNLDCGANLCDRDVRQVLKTVRKEILVGCKILLSRIPSQKSSYVLEMAKQLGATFSKECDMSVTHVVSLDPRSERSRWAVQHNKFLVHPRWIVAANYRWRKPPEEDFPVKLAISVEPSNSTTTTTTTAMISIESSNSTTTTTISIEPSNLPSETDPPPESADH